MRGSIYEKKDLTFFLPQGRGGTYQIVQLSIVADQFLPKVYILVSYHVY